MFTQNANVPSLSDIAAVTGNNRNNDGWGGDGAWLIWIVLIFALFGFGGFGNGWGGNGMNGGVGSEVQRGFDTQSIVSKLDGITNGLCDGFYSQNTTMLQGFNGLQNTISNGFHGVDNAICNLGYNVQQGFNTTNIALMQGQNALQTQLAQCCCENREGQAQIRYDMATQACDTRQTVQNAARDIIDNSNANSRAILDFLTQDKIATLTAENQSLKFAASQTAQNQFITQVGSDIVNRLQPVPVPAFPASNLYAYAGNACGCNSCGC